MLITRPRKRAGHVSATSIDPSDHSPFSAKLSIERAIDENGEGRRQRHDRHQQREHRDIDREQGAAAEPVGKPRPEIQPGDAEGERDLQAGPIVRDGERELLDDQRRDQRKDHAVHAVEAPAQPIGDGDVPMRPGDFGRLGDGAIIGVLQMLLLEGSDACCTIRRRGRQPTPPRWLWPCSSFASSCAARSIRPSFCPRVRPRPPARQTGASIAGYYLVCKFCRAEIEGATPTA